LAEVLRRRHHRIRRRWLGGPLRLVVAKARPVMTCFLPDLDYSGVMLWRNITPRSD
jgi:hypothetical protein